MRIFKSVSRYPWLISQFYTDFLQTLLSRSYNSLEWCLNCPPKPHAFASLPLQSGFNTYIKRIINNIIIFIKLKSLFFITTLLKLLSFMHKYNTLYKIWLNRSSGQKVIIYIYLFLEIIAIALISVVFIRAYWSAIQAISRSPVPISGAGTFWLGWIRSRLTSS